MVSCSKCNGAGTIPVYKKGEKVCPKCKGRTKVPDTAKVTLKLIRSFGVGIRFFPPTLNGLCVEVFFACFMLHVWLRGNHWFGFSNHWNG
jgi:hypothetical protein